MGSLLYAAMQVSSWSGGEAKKRARSRLSLVFCPQASTSEKPRQQFDSGASRCVRQNYCERLAQYYCDKGYKRFKEKPRISDHLNWTIRVHVVPQTSDDTAIAFETIATEAGRTINGVRKAVKDTLVALGLPLQPTFRPGKRVFNRGATVRMPGRRL